MAFFKVIGLLCLTAAALGVPAQDATRGARNSIQTEKDLLNSVYQDCLKKDTLSCVKYKVFSVVDKVLDQSDITITDGVQIVKTGDAPSGARAISSDDTIESAMLSKATSFLETHSVKFDLSGKEIVSAITNTARSLSEDEEETDSLDEEEGRAGKKKIKKIKKIFGPLMGIFALKAALLGKIALFGLALLAGKALIISKIALVLAGILAIKKLFGSKGGLGGGLGGLGGAQIHTSSHLASHEGLHGVSGGYGGDLGGGYSGGYAASSGHGGWGRSTDAQELAYKGYVATKDNQ